MIGLVTPYNVYNYGSKLQAYALQKIFDDNGVANEIIQYTPSSDRKMRLIIRKIVSPLSWYSVYLRSKQRKLSLVNNKLLVEHKLYESIKIRNNAIDSFDTQYRLSPNCIGKNQLIKHSKSYAAIVVGSDQVWNPMNIPAKYTTLEFAELNTKRIAFSASFGVADIYPSFLKKYYSNFLEKMDYISVREKDGVNLCRELVPGKEVVELADPTLIINPFYWFELSEVSVDISEPYCFCYFLGDNIQHREIARELANKFGYKIVSLSHFKCYNQSDEGFADIECYDISPEKFLSLIRNANLVLTDSFHCTVFSVIFHRKFYVFERYLRQDKASANSRIYNILDKLSLTQRMITSKNFRDQDINFENTDAILSNIRSEAQIQIEKIINCMEAR